MRTAPPLQSLVLLTVVLLSGPASKAQSAPGKLVFADEFGRLEVINTDGTGQTVITANGAKEDRNPVFSPDGSKIAFDRMQGFGTNIYIMNADGTNQVALTTGGDTSFQVVNSSPSFSPDGTKLAFASNRNGLRKLEIWIMNVDGTGLVQLTTNVQLSSDSGGPVFSNDGAPAWSPDGSRIAFVSTRDGLTDFELYVMNADGSNPTRLTDNPVDDRSPTWSPDSQRIAFNTSGLSTIGINIVNRDGTNAVNVTHDGGEPAWSPDGLKLAYVASDPNTFFKAGIFLINIDGTNTFKVTNNQFSCRSPKWAPSSSAPCSVVHHLRTDQRRERHAHQRRLA